MKDENHPCYRCTERVLGCHSTCERYKTRVAKDKARKALIGKGRDEKRKEIEYNIRKCKRNKHYKKK